MVLEICVDSVESAIAAARGGAQRVELCSALGEGGVTPSAGLIRAVRRAVPIDIYLIIRPRSGDFVYTERDLEVMRDDIRDAQSAGVNGIALGLLREDGQVDTERTRSLIELARPLGVTFHRAFDLTADLDRALEDVIACGAERILTSGGEADAMRGMDRIGRLREQAGDRIRIMAGGGIRRSNVRRLAERTGVRDIHTSLSNTLHSNPGNGHTRARIGSRPGENARFLVTEEDVRAVHTTLESLADRPARRVVAEDQAT